MALVNMYRTVRLVSSIDDGPSADINAPCGRRDLTAFAGLSKDELSLIQNLPVREYAAWRYLADRLGKACCRECANEALRAAGVGSGQPAAVIRGLRVQGFDIPKDQRTTCAVHGSKTADQLVSLVPVTGASRVRWSYSNKEKSQMRAACGSADAFDGSVNAPHKLELDHRVPMRRASEDEQRIDPADPEAVRKTFMLLTPVHNLRKDRACESCEKTGVRPPSLGGVHYWFIGDEVYDPSVGCNGCFWAYPEQWYSRLDALVSSKNSDK